MVYSKCIHTGDGLLQYTLRIRRPRSDAALNIMVAEVRFLQGLIPITYNGYGPELMDLNGKSIMWLENHYI